MPVTPELSVVIPTRNRLRELQRCVESVFRSTLLPTELIVVDDASHDGTNALDTFPDAPCAVRVIHLLHQVMMAEARNIGARTARGSLILFIDDDNVIDSQMIELFVATAHRLPMAGMIGPVMYTLSSGKAQTAFQRVSLWNGHTSGPARVPNREFVDSDGIPNVFLVRREVFERCGYFDRELLATYSEVDLHFRARRLGYHSVIVTEAKTFHDNRAHRSLVPRTLGGGTFVQKSYTMIRNRMVMVQRYGSRTQRIVFAICWSWLWPTAYSLLVLPHRRFDLIRLYWRGFSDGIRYQRTGILRSPFLHLPETRIGRIERWKLLLRQGFIIILSLVFRTPLPPPSPREAALVQELKDALPEPRDALPPDAPPSEVSWTRNVNRLRQLIKTKDPRAFLRWDVVTWTMFVAFAPYMREELAFLQSLPTWAGRWRAAIRESPVGHPLPYPWYRESSGNLIHHAYHLAQFEEKTGLPINQLAYVFEFGGGYGSMCRLFHALGFRGTYVLFDLPLFSALQQFYLRSLNIPVYSFDRSQTTRPGTLCLSNLEDVPILLSADALPQPSLFLATWSLSETPLSLRQTLLPLLSPFRAFLVAYQHQFEEVNNSAFFRAWREAVGTDVRWHSWDVAHIPGNSYLMGAGLDHRPTEPRTRTPGSVVRARETQVVRAASRSGSAGPR